MSGIYFPSSTTSNNAIAFQSLVGPLVSVGEISALGGTFSKYETNFATYEAQHWSSDGVSWATSNYYDRAFIEYQWYARTGDVTFLNRGNALAEDYLHNYVEANNYKVESWWSMPKGITAHYLLNGDAASLTAIGKIADGVCIPWNCNNNWANLTDPHFAEGREQARALETLTQAILIDAPSQDGHDFRAMAKSLVETLLSDQHADGSRPSYVTTTPDGKPIDKPFMNGLVNEAMINYYEQVEADPRIITYVKANLDYMWANEWDAGARAFQYLDLVPRSDPDGITPAPDLNGLIVTGFGFVYQHTGDATYLQRGDQVFAGGVDGAWLTGSKQFNQSYAYSLNYLGDREAGDGSNSGPAPSPLESRPTASSLKSSPVPS